MKFTFERAHKIKSVYVRNGYGWGQRWAEKNRVKELKIEAGAGEAVVTLLDTDELQETNFPKLPKSETLKMTILSVYPGTKSDDTCVAEIAFNKHDDYDTSFTLDIPKTEWRIIEMAGDRFLGVIQQQGRYDHIENQREVEEYTVEMNANGRITDKKRLLNESVERMIVLNADRIFVHKRRRVKESTYRDGKVGNEIQENLFFVVDGAGHVRQEIHLRNRLVLDVLRLPDESLLLVSAHGKFPELDIATLNSSGKILWEKTIMDNVQLPPMCLNLSDIQVRIRNSQNEGLLISFRCDTARYQKDSQSISTLDNALIIALNRDYRLAWQRIIQPMTESFPNNAMLVVNDLAELDGKVIALGNLTQYWCPSEQPFAQMVDQSHTVEIETGLSGYQGEAAIRYASLHHDGGDVITIFGTRLEPYLQNGCDDDGARPQEFSYFSIDVDKNGRVRKRRAWPGLPIVSARDRPLIFKSDTSRRSTVKNDWDVPFRTPVQKIFKVTRRGRMLDL